MEFLVCLISVSEGFVYLRREVTICDAAHAPSVCEGNSSLDAKSHWLAVMLGVLNSDFGL